MPRAAIDNKGDSEVRLTSLGGRFGPVARHLLTSGLGGGLIMVTNRVALLLVAVIFARLLGVEGYGVYSFAIALAAVLGVLVEFGMVTFLVREVASAHSREDWAAINRVSASSKRLVLLLAVAISLVGLPVVWLLDEGLAHDLRLALTAMFGYIALNTLLRIQTAKLNGLRKVLTAQVVETLVPPLLLLVMAAAIWFSSPDWFRPLDAMLAQVVAAAAALTLAWFLLARHLPKRQTGDIAAIRSQRLLASGLPFFLIGTAMLINVQVDSIIVTLVLGTGETGLYRVGVQGATLTLAGTTVISNITAPFFARYHAQGDWATLGRLYRFASLASFGFVGAVFAGYLLFGRWLIDLSFGAQYGAAYPILLILTAGYVANAAFGPIGTLMAMCGFERLVSRCLWVTGLANIVFSLIAAYALGAIGVAVVTALTISSYHAVLRIFLYRRTGL